MKFPEGRTWQRRREDAGFDLQDGTGGPMAGPADLGGYNVDAYVLYWRLRWTANGAPLSTLYAFRVARAGEGMSCSVQIVGAASSKAPCTLTRR
jgi:hypothetical protein